MRLFLPTFLLLVTGVACQYIVLPETHPATLEDISKTTENCTIIDVFPEKKNLSQACSIVRSKRWYYIVLDPRREPTRAELEQKKKDEEARELEHIRKVGLLLNNTLPSSFAEFSELLTWNGTKLAEFFKYDNASDAWVSLKSKRLECNGGVLELHVCGKINPDRKRGEHKFVSPIGFFSSLGTVYKRMDLPFDAVRVNKQLRSAVSCRWLSTLYECTEDKRATCSVQYYQDCPQTAFLTPQKIFVQSYGEQTLIAADFDTYETFINDTVTTHKIDFSKLVFMRLPFESFAKFGDVKVFGRATSDFEHFSISKHAYASELTHEDLDELEAIHGPIVELTENRKTIPYFFTFQKQFILVVFFLVLCSAVICKLVYSYPNRRELRYSKFEPRVLFFNQLVTDNNDV